MLRVIFNATLSKIQKMIKGVEMSAIRLKSLFLKNKTFRQIIFKNTFWLVISAIIRQVVSFVVVILIARHFGPVIYGKLVFGLSFVGLFAVAMDFGFSYLVVREVARHKEKSSQYIDNIILIKFILSLIGLSLIAVVINLLGKEADVIRLVYFLGIYTVINTFTVFFYSIFRANEQMQYETVCAVFQSLGLLGLVGFLIAGSGSLVSISFAYIGSTVVGIVLSLIFVRKYFSRFLLKVNLSICWKLLKQVWPFGLTFIFISGYYHTDVIMLYVMKSDIAVGWYGAAHRFLLLLIGIPSLLQGVFFPRLSHAFISSKDKFKNVFNHFLRYIFIISFPICIGVMLLSGRLILLVYGRTFEQSILVLQMLIWSFLFAAIGGAFGSALNSSDRQIALMKITGAAFGANILLNLMLIPRFSYMGAVFATNLTRFFVISIEAVLLYRIGFLPGAINYWKIWIKIISSTAVMGIFIVLFKEINLFILMPFAALIYFSLLYLMKGLNIARTVKDQNG